MIAPNFFSFLRQQHHRTKDVSQFCARSQGSHGSVPGQSVRYWQPGFPAPCAGGGVSPWHEGCCLTGHGGSQTIYSVNYNLWCRAGLEPYCWTWFTTRISVQQAAFSTTEMALALNRYLCSAVLPLITKCAPLFAGSDHRAIMIDSMLHTIYRLSRGRAFTKAQRDIIEECLMALCKSVDLHGNFFM